MSEEIQQSGGELLADAVDQKLAKLPFKTVTLHPTTELRMRIVALAQKLNISAREVLKRLLATAADLKIPWIVIQPQNGSEAGITFAQVEKVMVKVFNLFNQVAGTFYRMNANQQAKQVEVMREGALELWIATQKLAKETFFDPTEYKIMCECHDSLGSNLQYLKLEIQGEEAKEKPNHARIEEWKKRIAGYETTRRVLKRLGCGGSHNAI